MHTFRIIYCFICEFPCFPYYLRVYMHMYAGPRPTAPRPARRRAAAHAHAPCEPRFKLRFLLKRVFSLFACFPPEIKDSSKEVSDRESGASSPPRRHARAPVVGAAHQRPAQRWATRVVYGLFPSRYPRTCVLGFRQRWVIDL